MRYRKLSNSGDYQLGVWLENTPETVAQAVLTRLKLWRGEWFMDTSEGTPYMQNILGHNTSYDLELKARILGTQGVVELTDYSSVVDRDRNLIVTCTLSTLYGQINMVLPQ